MRNTKKIEMTAKEEAWMRLHFKHTKNDEIAARFGWSHSTLHRFARQLGLTKTRQFMHKCQAATTAAAKESHLRNGTYPPKGYRIPRSEEFCFKPGEKPVDRIGKRRERQRIRKMKETIAETRRVERARAVFGLERKTKLKLAGMGQPRHFALQRYYLRQLGYIIARGSMDAYYTQETKRSKEYESRTRENCDNFVPFRFKPLPHEINES